jgi:hypothetical protein
MFCSVIFAEEPYKIDFSRKIFSNLSDEEKSILSEYAKDYPQIKQRYRNMRMNVTGKSYSYLNDNKYEFSFPQDGALILMDDCEFEIRYLTNSSTDYRRVDTLTLFSFSSNDEIKKRNKLRFVSREVSLILPTEVLSFRKIDPNQQYELHYKVDREKMYNEYGFVVMMFDKAPYAYRGTDLEEMFFGRPTKFLKDIEYFIDSVKTIEVGGEELVEIRSHFDNSYSYIFKLSRKHWGLIETVTRYKDGNYMKTFCTYDKLLSEGIPRLVSYGSELWWYDSVTQKMRIRNSNLHEVTKLELEPPPLSEFEVSQFLPSGTTAGIKTAVFSWFRIFCIVAGLLFLIISIGLKIKFMKKHD